jgi:UDP:flavonoid glycosyltransferase YjiC (YdhE family)
MTSPGSIRILFVAEDVTDDQVTRLVSLARSLPHSGYEIWFACARVEESWFAGTHVRTRAIESMPRSQILRAVAEGRQAYDAAVLERYLEEDRRLLREVRPDLVVANFRPSLSVSAPLEGVPVATVVSAHWSPYAVRSELPVPDHPMVRKVGVALAKRFLPKALPTALALFAKPINDLRKKYGLRRIGSLREVMTWGDVVLQPDTPELAPTRGAPSTHHYLGRIPWSAPVPVPEWWDELPADRPTVYVTLGSSGNLEAWPTLREALGTLPINVLLATAGRVESSGLPKNFWAADYLPGHQAARRAELVVTNGGSGSSYQALSEGKPVVGVASNLDQHLAMSGVERAGAGVTLRAANLTVDEVRQAVSGLIASPAHAAAARRLGEQLSETDAGARFTALVDELTRERRVRVSA